MLKAGYSDIQGLRCGARTTILSQHECGSNVVHGYPMRLRISNKQFSAVTRTAYVVRMCIPAARTRCIAISGLQCHRVHTVRTRRGGGVPNGSEPMYPLFRAQPGRMTGISDALGALLRPRPATQRFCGLICVVVWHGTEIVHHVARRSCVLLESILARIPESDAFADRRVAFPIGSSTGSLGGISAGSELAWGRQ